MFEESLQTDEWREKQAAEGRSADNIAALRTAAIIIAINAILAIVLARNIIQCIVGVVLASYLYKLRPRAENYATGVAIIGSILMPILAFLSFPVGLAIVISFGTWGVTGPILLLLVGETNPTRRKIAVAIFVIVTVSVYLLTGMMLAQK